MLARVAEDIATRDVPSANKVRILLAIIRALSGPLQSRIESGLDVDAMAIADPERYEDLLRGYWLLHRISKGRK